MYHIIQCKQAVCDKMTCKPPSYTEVLSFPLESINFTVPVASLELKSDFMVVMLSVVGVAFRHN